MLNDLFGCDEHRFISPVQVYNIVNLGKTFFENVVVEQFISRVQNMSDFAKPAVTYALQCTNHMLNFLLVFGNIKLVVIRYFFFPVVVS